ncbi:MAG: NAD-dependent epimerase/dehydratase family protein [Verrucomicrobia bacterium]|nr:NAD-dependent epimerase/dehydratase family protein [Verrucomicrobiota bacterium]NDD56309.1 NAD-dependent epimerase/dehydratase family protein [Verrucomicrobiota bacterium]NDD81027.1 NAD-dependent epimerase/dehydratase family protein [Verrucomicrobiota bacterium]
MAPCANDNLFPRSGHMIVVTGGTGFVGREICRRLAAQGIPVRAVARNSPTETLPAGVSFFPADVCRSISLREAMEGAQAVIHCVGIIREKGEATFDRIHRHAVAETVAAAHRARIPRFIFLSALGTRSAASSLYHRSKWAGEEIVRQSGLAATILRPSLVYGPGDQFTNFLAAWMRPPLSWLTGGFLGIPGGDSVNLCPASVGEVAEAVVRSLGKDRALGQSFDLAGPSISLKNLSLEIARAMGLRPTWVEQPPDVFLGMVPWLLLTASKPVLHPVPLPLCRIAAAVAERILPNPPLTTDQVSMLEEGQYGDSRPAEEILGFHPGPLFAGLAAYLAPRAGGIADRRP